MNQAMIAELNKLLADYAVLYQKLRGYHWRVSGPAFFQLHEKFGELYGEAAGRADEVAERIRALGGEPLSTLRELATAARLAEDGSTVEAAEMVRALAADYRALNGRLRAAAAKAAEAGDTATVNLLEEFADHQEKTVWMLSAWLAGAPQPAAA